MMRLASLALMTAVWLACSACGGLLQAPQPIRYYTLEYAPPAPSDAKALACSLRIERFQSAPTYASDRIVYRESAFQRQTYAYHRWRTAPSDLVTFFLARDLRQSGLYAAVVGYDSRFSTSHAVEGTLVEFMEIDRADRWEAVVAISVTLIRENEPDASRRVAFQRFYSEREACEEKVPAAVVKAMSAAFSRITATISTDIYALLAADDAECGSR